MMYIVLLMLTCLLPEVDSWNPHAGLVLSWTKMAGATATATSSTSPPNRVLDDNDNTNWVSDSCLPNHFISRNDSNIFLGSCGQGQCSTLLPGSDMSHVTDGKTSSSVAILASNGQAQFTLTLLEAKVIKLMTIWGIYKSDTTLMVHDEAGNNHVLRKLTTSDNYRDITVDSIPYKVTKIVIQSTSQFSIKELAALGSEGCAESITVDMGASREVATIRTRHWTGSGNALSIDLLVSDNNVTWTKVASLEPGALHAVYTRVNPAIQARYIQLKYNVILQKYKKVYCFEIDAWNITSKWGKKPAVIPQTKTIRQVLGVNGIWGWGHSMYSSRLSSTQGAGLYNRVASGARNYHNLDWDVRDPDNDPEFTRMKNGGGTDAKSWLNWDLEYTAWVNANLSVDASIQFTNKSFSQTVWNYPEQSAFRYGQEFAKHFGPSQGNGLVSAMEVGNEPWDYDATFYKTVLKGMSTGARSVDNQIYILPGAFQAHASHDSGNYIGTRVTQDSSTHLSAVNFHTYSYRQTENGIRIGTYPEHPDSTFNSINNICRWRNANMPNKPIWVTEWGWDSPGSGEDCTFPECVSEKAQAVYAVRGIMILLRSGVERAHWFFYANLENVPCNHIYCRSGLTTSKRFNFDKKLSFLALESLLDIIGDSYFLGTVREDDQAYVYAFGNPQHLRGRSSNLALAVATHVVAWRPISADDSSTIDITFRLPPGSSVAHEWTITGSTPMLISSHSAVESLSDVRITLTSSPVILQLRHAYIGPVVGK